MERDLKAIQALKLLQLLTHTAPGGRTARELSGLLGLHPRAVYRYLAELGRHVDVRRDGPSYRVVGAGPARHVA